MDAARKGADDVEALPPEGVGSPLDRGDVVVEQHEAGLQREEVSRPAPEAGAGLEEQRDAAVDVARQVVADRPEVDRQGVPGEKLPGACGGQVAQHRRRARWWQGDC